VQRVQGRIYHLLRQPAEATSALLAAATELGSVDIRLARDILVEAIVDAQINGRLAPGGTTRADVARVAESLPLPPGAQPTPGDFIVDADAALQLHGLASAAPHLRQAIDAVRRDSSESPEVLQWLAAACADATILADDVALHELARRMEVQARDQGAVIPLALALSHAGASELVAGDLLAAERCFIELAAIVEARGFDWSLGSLLIAAWRGQAKQAYALLDTVSAEAARQGQGYQLVFADYARCILELGFGHYREAYASVRADTDDTSQLKFAFADLVEAAQRSGEHYAAQCHVDRLAELAAISPTSRNVGLLARARAIVCGDAAEAEDLYEQAVAQHALLRGPAHLARSHLVYGEWLRRSGRRRDAREHLRAAHVLFEEMGARAFSSRARTELQATGETLRPRRSVEADTHLTPQEEHVARLAAVGATNAEIAAQLYLSAYTVDYHLRKVFRKLGVASRRQLFRSNPDSA
jgi:DNA-binding CsgD family transcriptional regulator